MALARGHLNSVRLLRGDEESDLDTAYLTAQAAEKAARAVVENAGYAVGTTHNFQQIAALLPGDHTMRAAIMELDSIGLSTASTRYRYPDPSGRVPRPPRPDEMSSRIAKVEAFMELVQNHLSPPKAATPDLEQLATGLRLRALAKGWEVPDNFVEKIQIYAADGAKLSAITADLDLASSLSDLLERHDIRFDGLTDR